MTPRDRLARAALKAVLGLPERAQRPLAGRPVRIDGQTLDVDVQLMLRLQRVAGEPELGVVDVEAGRRALRRQAAIAGGRQPIGATRDLTVAGRPARLHVPTAALASGSAPGPLLVFVHGGGFIAGDLTSHDAACRFLAERAGIRVLAITYRLAPEHPFPAAYDDAVAAYRWALENADRLGADAARTGVGGDSAGGNLAAGVARTAAGDGLPCAVQLLLYPVTGRRRDTRSAELFSEGFYLTREFMDLADRSYLRDEGDRGDPRFAPATADLGPVAATLAPALVYTAGFDPLRDEGQAYAELLRRAGVAVTARRFPGQIHGFINLVGAGRTSRAASDQVVRDLRSALT